MPSGHSILSSDVLISWSSVLAEYSFPSVFIFPALRAVWLFLASAPLPSSVNTEASKALGGWQCLHLLQIHHSCHVLEPGSCKTIWQRAMHWLEVSVQKVKLVFFSSNQRAVSGKEVHCLTSEAALTSFTFQKKVPSLQSLWVVHAVHFKHIKMP